MVSKIYFKAEKEKKTKKAKAWMKLGERYNADVLHIIPNGESFDAEVFPNVIAKQGFMLEWNTKEDNIKIYGDGDMGADGTSDTIIVVDEPTYLPESIKKLELAMKALKEVQANKKIYYWRK